MPHATCHKMQNWTLLMSWSPTKQTAKAAKQRQTNKQTKLANRQTTTTRTTANSNSHLRSQSCCL